MNTLNILLEDLRRKELFRKVIFKIDFSKLSASERLGLMSLVKKYYGESLKREERAEFWYAFLPDVDIQEFISDATSFNPEASDETIESSRFKPRQKGLKDGQKIKFLDYKTSELNPQITTGYLKPGFIGTHKSLMKWPSPDGPYEDWIYNKFVDSDDFYHREFGGVDPSNVKIEFSEDISSLDDRDKEYLKDIIKKYKGTTANLFGKQGYKSSGDKNYTLIPTKDFNFDEFYQDAEEFGPYYAEREKGGMMSEEEKIICEVRKIVRSIIKERFYK